MCSIKSFIFLLLFLIFSLDLFSQELYFNKDGRFKIVQFTDTHICPTKKESQITIEVIKKTLQKEHPNLVIFTGDNVTGKPLKGGWDMMLKPLIETKVPFCILMGNHDINKTSIADYKNLVNTLSSIPNCLNTKDKNGNLIDIAIKIKNKFTQNVGFVIYGFDSHSYSTFRNKGISGYGWIKPEQIEWYRKESNALLKDNQNDTIPSLAFFHIPLPEYKLIGKNRRLIECGTRKDKESPPKINSGLFSAFLEQGDVMGIFTGHEHGNDYIAKLHGITLGYGRFSGGKTTYTKLSPGARIIIIYDNKPQYSTYVRLLNGSIHDVYIFHYK